MHSFCKENSIILIKKNNQKSCVLFIKYNKKMFKIA